MKLRAPFRVLPAVLIGAGLLLVGKVGALWFEPDAPATASAPPRQIVALEAINPAAGKADEAEPAVKKVAEETASNTAEKSGKAETSKNSEKTEKAAGEKKKAARPAATAEGEAKAKETDHADAAPADEHAAGDGESDGEEGGTGARLGLDDEDFDPMMLSRAEIELLQGLSKRRAALEEREREFALKEQTLAAAEQKLDAKIKALEELKKTVEGLVVKYDKQEEERMRSLVKIYENMKPREAASILGGLEQDTLLDVIERMKEAKSAPILALLNPARAKMITEELIARRRLPKPEDNS